ncbi:MAG: hypothetical protein JW932_19765 [Deltaproteobacteria bacterium]|nr:hypothetical protein [Deltaproteobacteria bacterium]
MQNVFPIMEEACGLDNTLEQEPDDLQRGGFPGFFQSECIKLKGYS